MKDDYGTLIKFSDGIRMRGSHISLPRVSYSQYLCGVQVSETFVADTSFFSYRHELISGPIELVGDFIKENAACKVCRGAFLTFLTGQPQKFMIDPNNIYSYVAQEVQEKTQKMKDDYYEWKLGTVCNQCDTLFPTGGSSICPECGLMDDYRWVGAEYLILADDTKFQTGWIRGGKDNKMRKVNFKKTRW